MAEKRLKYTAEQIDSAIEKVKNMPSEGIVGPQGPIGETGATGAAGKDGKEIELQKTSSYIQWRYVGGSWNNLVALADLKGDKGDGANVDLNDYALKSWVNEQIARVQAGGSVDLSSYYTKTEIDTKLSSKADSTTVTSHTSDTTSHITSAERISWNSKSTLALGTSSSTAFRGDYGNVAYTHSQSAHAPYNAEANVQADWNVSDTSSDAYIKNKPVIPVAYDDSEIRSSLDNLESEVNELKEGNIQIDLTNYATKSELHSHSNKSVLDNITSSKISEWDNKSDFSGDYNDLTNKPTIPTKTSQLTNNSGFITSIPDEYVTETELDNKGYLTQHQDISGKADKSTLTAHTSDTTIHITEAERNTWNNMSNGNDEYIEEKINEILGEVLEENLGEEISDLIVENVSDTLKGSIRVSNVFSSGQTLTGGYLSIMDDDNAKQVWDILKPMSEELNVPFCLAVPSNDIKVTTGGSMTKEQLKYLQDNLNWEICGHTVSHTQLGSLTYEQQLKEIRDNKSLLASYGLDVRGLAYPFGGYNSDTLAIMSQYYDYGFNGGQDYKYNTIDTFENYMIYRIAFGSYEPTNSNNGSLQYYKDKIDEVIDNNGWLVLMTHITDTNHTTDDTENLKQLIQYAKERNMTISTPNKIFDKFKNLIEIPNKLKITNTGIINEFANKEKVNILNDDTKVATDLLTSFKENTITYTKAYKKDVGNENLPDNGTLETVNIGTLNGIGSVIKDYTFRHQKLYGLNGNIWYRQPVKYNDWTWGEWKVLLGKTEEDTSGGSSNIITETIVVPGYSIQPHTCVRFGVELVNKNKINLNTAIVLRPQGGIEDNIVYNVDMWSANSFGIKLLNIGNGARNTAERTWTVKIIN